MVDIYSNAITTIAAPAAENCDLGLYYELAEQISPGSAQFQIISQDYSLVYLITHPFTFRDHKRPLAEDTSLFNRVWVLQERQLSRRVLHFAANGSLLSASKMFAANVMLCSPVASALRLQLYKP